MAAHRYWRAREVFANSSSDYVWLVLELNLRGISGGPNIATGGTPIGSPGYYSSSELPSHAFDGNLGTWWQGGNPPPVWIGYDFGDGNEVDVVEWYIRCWTSYPARTANVIAFEWSDDGVAWTLDFLVRAGNDWGSFPDKTFTRAPAAAVAPRRYWAVLGTSFYSNCSCSRLRFRNPEGIELPKTTAITDGALGGYPAAAVADEDENTFWVSTGSVGYIGYDLGVGVEAVVAELDYSVRPIYFNEAFREGVVMSSPDGVTWDFIWSFSTGPWTDHETRTFTAPEGPEVEPPADLGVIPFVMLSM